MGGFNICLTFNIFTRAYKINPPQMAFFSRLRWIYLETGLIVNIQWYYKDNHALEFMLQTL